MEAHHSGGACWLGPTIHCVTAIELARIGPDDWRGFREVRLASLLDAPGAFGSTYDDWVDAPEERWRARLSDVPFTQVARGDQGTVGMVSGMESGQEVELISMWVAPDQRGTGLAGRLIDEVIRWATARGKPTCLMVRQDNIGAIRAYARAGFVDHGVPENWPESDPAERRMCHELAHPPDRLDTVFLTVSSIALELVRRSEVSDQWGAPSVLPQMSVGALACHLGRQAVRAAELLPVATDVAPLASADAHYDSAAWVTSTSPDDPPNDRSLDDADAESGPGALTDRTVAALDAVRRMLEDGSAQDVVLIPWQGWSLRRDHFLLTRMLEIVVHSDDLALSVGVATPEFPDEVFVPVRDLLLRLAVARHGQSPVIGTLTRRERSGQISAF